MAVRMSVWRSELKILRCAQDDSEDKAQDDSEGGQCSRSFASAQDDIVALRMTVRTKLRMTLWYSG